MDCIMDKLGDVWRYWGRFGGSHGGHVVALSTVYWGCCSKHGVLAGHLVGVLGEARRYSEAVWWGIGTHLGILGCPFDPWNNSGPILGHLLAPGRN